VVHDARQRLGGDSGYADTVLSLPPSSIAEAQAPLPGDAAGPSSEPAAARGPEAGGDADLGADPGAEAEDIVEQPTLSHIGRYALKRQIGEGGLGRVYEAWDPLLSRAVAVKTLNFDLDMPSRLALDRILLNEARAAANLNHPHIVTIFDAGLAADNGVYIAMERLRGRDLRQALADGWRPTPLAAAQIVRRAADALAYAHARGLVHCDIKPANIFLTRRQRPKVLDFGIARAASSSAVPRAREATIAGSPHYLAPEQLSGGVIDARTDLHALGVVLYELLTGRKAFAGDSLESIHRAVLESTPPQVHELCRAVPPALSAIVARAMARDPAHRFASAAELAVALRQWCESATGPAGEDPAPPADRGERTIRLPRHAFAGAGLAAVGVALALWLWDDSPLANRATAPATAAAAAAVASQPAASLPPSAGDATMTPRVAAADAAARRVPTIAVDPPLLQPSAKPAPTRRPTASTGDAPPPSPDTSAATGLVQLAVSPWGEVEVNGHTAGTTPPLTRLTLPAGTHQITLRNADFTPHTVVVDVQGDHPVTIRHRFGS
jgi:serine/threonine-protein kinase